MSTSSSSSTHNKAPKASRDQVVYASINQNYPFWCSTFEHDLRNYYQPHDEPLELYLGAAANEHPSCFHTSFNLCPSPVHDNPTRDKSRSPSYSSSSSSHCYLEHHPHCRPHYNPYYINYRHVATQINVRHRSVPLVRENVDYVSLEAEEEAEALAEEVEMDCQEAGRKRKRRHDATRTRPTGVADNRTGMYVTDGTVMVRHTGLEVKPQPAWGHAVDMATAKEKWTPAV